MGQLVAAQEGGLDKATDDPQVQQFLTFNLQDEMFGLNILPIKEIIEYGNVTTVPMVPSYVRGVINLRGNVVPVIDLPVRFGWSSSKVNKRTCIVIVEVDNEGERLDIGVVIDSVSEVVDIPEEDVGSAPSFGARVRTDFIAGMGRLNGEFIVLLNVNKVLAIEELAQLGGIQSDSALAAE